MSSRPRSPNRSGRSGLGPNGRAPRRDLGDVLHFFIPEEEQRAAREPAPDAGAAVPDPLRAPAPGVRWCMPASPERMLGCALALDLATALSHSGPPTRVLASFAAPAFLPEAPRVRWQHAGDLVGDPARLAERLDWTRDQNDLVLLPADAIGRTLRGLRAGALDGVLLPVDSTSRGLTRAMNWLTRLGDPLAGVRIGVTLIGADDGQEADRLYQKLAGAARRQLGLPLEKLGKLRRDRTADRSLLLGVPVLNVDGEGEASENLRELCASLR